MAEKHQKVETNIGGGQWIIREATEIRPEIATRFDEARGRLRESNKSIVKTLREGRRPKSGSPGESASP
jgi:hypothetical protein